MDRRSINENKLKMSATIGLNKFSMRHSGSIKDGLIGYWSMNDEATGTVLDSLGRHNGTAYVITQHVATGIGGGYGTEWTSALGERVTLSYDSLIIPNYSTYSLSLWFYAHTLPTVQGEAYRFWEYRYNQSPWQSLRMIATSANYINFIVHDVFGTMYYAYTNATFSVDTWYHLVGLCQGVGSPLKLYVNGSQTNCVNSSNLAYPIDIRSYAIRMGAATSSAGDTLDGLMAEVGFWDRVLTADEITWLYNSGSGRAFAAF